MIKTRVIPVLLWDERGLVKPIRFERPGRFVGSLMSAALIFEARNCDELILLDVALTAPRLRTIQQFTSKLFCPLAVGGGVRSVDDIRNLLHAGADKVVLPGSASTGLIRAAADKFGSQSVAVHLTYTEAMAREIPLSCAHMAHFGAGEIILTSIDRDGTRRGYDLDTIAAAARSVDIPVIASGGCRNPSDMVEAIRHGAHAVAASTMFLFDNITPADCAAAMAEAGIPMRLEYA